ncbi:carboxymuconolactone decarboxylase family protein [Novosphingobium mangrovi (ex Huang et al. 2023)]|uniref:Carboxymuconolactone decarboxylase family protein n=1 Tax=Novosphingobium mangrovi (ex Huang et al. 2023) TaxID=2976432 RepID=A0ABT2I0N2_9SPHN|nr:carboxymuconolactone decarboxylase family protein [Novosphingobium mangrovi (ex Huang et al. 2023)]MCT2398359.1 carboxymuconolactone decarboxylase family protein [Novosphingobium mangrovi (ex Huang et al. 2023)]
MTLATAAFDPGFDIAAREAHVVGDRPRIDAVAQDDIDEASRELVHAVRAGAGAPRIDEVPEYMCTVLKHPDLFRCQMQMGTVLFSGRIPARERELAVLRIGWLCRAPYEWGQHVNIAYRVGLDNDTIARTRIGATAPGWTTHEAAILRGVEELLEDKVLSDATWTVLAQSWDEAQLIEFPMMVGQYVATAYVQNTLRIRLEGGNPGLTHE